MATRETIELTYQNADGQILPTVMLRTSTQLLKFGSTYMDGNSSEIKTEVYGDNSAQTTFPDGTTISRKATQQQTYDENGKVVTKNGLAEVMEYRKVMFDKFFLMKRGNMGDIEAANLYEIKVNGKVINTLDELKNEILRLDDAMDKVNYNWRNSYIDSKLINTQKDVSFTGKVSQDFFMNYEPAPGKSFYQDLKDGTYKRAYEDHIRIEPEMEKILRGGNDGRGAIEIPAGTIKGLKGLKLQEDATGMATYEPNIKNTKITIA